MIQTPVNNLHVFAESLKYHS